MRRSFAARAAVLLLLAAGGAAAAPDNDEKSGARRLTCGPRWTRVSAQRTHGAGPDSGLPAGCETAHNRETKKGVWYYFESARPKTVTLTSCRSDYDTVIKSYDSNAFRKPAEFEPRLIACRGSNNNAKPARGLARCKTDKCSTVVVKAPRRRRMYFLVTGAGGASGVLRMHCRANRPRSPFSITLVNTGTDTSQDAKFRNAKEHWERIIEAKVPAFNNINAVDLSAGFWPGYSWTKPKVDNIVIFYRIVERDGPGGNLGVGGVVYTRSNTNMPLSGLMEFDKYDIGTTLTNAQFAATVKHEMAHAMGFGTAGRCLSQSCVINSGSYSTYYACYNAQAQYEKACGGVARTTSRLQIETMGGPGSACSHWLEDGPLKMELLSPTLSRGNALSRITLGAFEDNLGPGSVDYLQADPFRCRSPRPMSLSNATTGGVFLNITLLEPTGMLE